MGGVLAAGAAGEHGWGWGRRAREGSPRAAAAARPCPGFQACDAWRREAKEAKERALAADSARDLALQKKEEVEAQFRRLREELEGRGLQRCADLGAVPLPKLHSLQSQLRLDLEAVDGVSPGSGSGRPPGLPHQTPSVPTASSALRGQGVRPSRPAGSEPEPEPERHLTEVALRGPWVDVCLSPPFTFAALGCKSLPHQGLL